MTSTTERGVGLDLNRWRRVPRSIQNKLTRKYALDAVQDGEERQQRFLKALQDPLVRPYLSGDESPPEDIPDDPEEIHTPAPGASAAPAAPVAATDAVTLRFLTAQGTQVCFTVPVYRVLRQAANVVLVVPGAFRCDMESATRVDISHETQPSLTGKYEFSAGFECDNQSYLVLRPLAVDRKADYKDLERAPGHSWHNESGESQRDDLGTGTAVQIDHRHETRLFDLQSGDGEEGAVQALRGANGQEGF